MHKWILVAEDNPQDAELTVRALLEGEAIEVILAQDGREALDHLSQCGAAGERVTDRPLLVLLDLKMPKIDGFEVLEHMRTHEPCKSIPVVIFSSSREESDLTRAYGCGANGYVVKPLNYPQYTAALKAIRTFWINFNEIAPVTGAGTACAASTRSAVAEPVRAAAG